MPKRSVECKELVTLLININTNSNVSLAIKDTKDELAAMGRTHSLKYISKLEKLLKTK